MKLSEITNKEKFLNVLEHIKEIGFTPYDIWFNDDDYADEETSICEFKIKELKGFLFAMWTLDRLDSLEYQIRQDYRDIWTDYLDIHHRSEIVFFTQYIRDIDKFKPSYSGFVTGMYRYSYKDIDNNLCEDWDYGMLEQILVYMKKHKIRSAEFAGTQARYIWDDDRTGFSIFCTYIHDWIYEYKIKLKKYIKFKWLLFVSKRFANKLKSFKVFIIDCGQNYSPRLDIHIRRKENINIVEYKKEQDIIDTFENKYFNNITILQYEFDILTDLNEEELKADKDLKIAFYDKLNDYKSGKRDIYDFKLLYENK